MNTPIDILRLWMLAAGTTQSALAEALGVSRSSMSKYINGNQRVSLQFACDVEKLTGGLVPPRYWLFEEGE